MKKPIAVLASLGLVGAGAVLVASPAHADPTPNHLETSNTVACGVATITLHNVSPWIYPVSVVIDGSHDDSFGAPTFSYGPTVDNRTDTDHNGTLDVNGPQQDASLTRTITFPEDSGVHTVSYRVAAGTESDLFRDLQVGQWTDLTVQSDCLGAATVTALSQSIAYGTPASEVSLTPTITGLAEGDTASTAGLDGVTCSTDAPVDAQGNYPAGTYAISCSGPASTPSYVVTYVPGTLTVDPSGTSLHELQVSAVRTISHLGYKYKATLTSNTTGLGIPGQVVRFSFTVPPGVPGPVLCTGTTNAGGVVDCFAPLTVFNLLRGLSLRSTAVYAGTPDYLPSFQIRPNQL